MGKLVQHEKLSGCWPSSASSSVDTDELFESVVDCNDVLLESAVSPLYTLQHSLHVHCVVDGM